tara:strand:- start:201 stop:374 length:174 start_codon:yes stop_codon:yes gene_type:complete
LLVAVVLVTLGKANGLSAILAGQVVALAGIDAQSSENIQAELLTPPLAERRAQRKAS